MIAVRVMPVVSDPAPMFAPMVLNMVAWSIFPDFLQFGAFLKKVLTVAEGFSVGSLGDLPADCSHDGFPGGGEGEGALEPDDQGM